jgi:uncharacterized protein involved in type VI secretion and phage assembly
MRSGGPKSEELDQVHFGLYYAVVTDNVDPDQKDRIKVKFPWLDDSDMDSSAWAQLITPMEGQKFGWYALPDIEDVVVVAFVQGDFRMPIILGGVWSTKDESPEPNEDGKNNFRGYRSRAGHRLVLDDSSKVKVSFVTNTTKESIGIGEFSKDGAGPNAIEVFIPPMAGSKGISFSSMDGNLKITAKEKFTVTATSQHVKINTTDGMTVNTGETTLEGTSRGNITSGSPSHWDGSQIKIA